MAELRPPNPNQLSTDLPGVTTYLTGHNSDGKAIVQETRPAEWKHFEDKAMSFNQIYTTSFPADLSDSKDIKKHDELMKSGTLGLVNKGGTVCRQVDFSPGWQCMMHRTQSLDYGIVLEGTIEMILDDGSKTIMRRGDVAVQRATMHAWKNASETEWARMQFILQDIQPLVIAGKKYGEDLGHGTEGLPSSSNAT